MQDETDGFFISPPEGVSVPSAGTEVRLSGVVGPSRTGIDSLQLRPLGSGDFPTPNRYSISELELGTHGADWVEVNGVVRAAQVQVQRLVLTVQEGTEFLVVRVKKYPESKVQSYVGARVRIRGAVVAHTSSGARVSSVQLYVPSTEQVEILQSAREMAKVPIQAVVDRTFDSNEGRVRVDGVVERKTAGLLFHLQDSTGAIQIQPVEEAAVHEGDSAEVVGFRSQSADRVYIRDAKVYSRTDDRSQSKESVPKDSLPTLRRVESVLSLSTDRAKRRYPGQIETLNETVIDVTGSSSSRPHEALSEHETSSS